VISNFCVLHSGVRILLLSLFIHDGQCAFIKKGTFVLFIQFSVPLCISKTLHSLQKLKISFSQQHIQNNYLFFFLKIMFTICFCQCKYNPSYQVTETHFKQCTVTQLM